jgi:hypothetical protein
MCVNEISLKNRQLYIVGQVATEKMYLCCSMAGLDNCHCGDLLPDEVRNKSSTLTKSFYYKQDVLKISPRKEQRISFQRGFMRVCLDILY